MRRKNRLLKNKANVLAKTSICFAVTVLICITILLCGINNMVSAEEVNTELIINQTTDSDGKTITGITNIQNYLNTPTKARAFRSNFNINNKIDMLLVALQYSDSEINLMTEEEKAEFARAEEAIVTYSVSAVEQNPTNDYSSTPQRAHELTIWSRVIREGKIETGDGVRHIYRLIGTAVYDKSYDSEIGIPVYRLKDALAFAWTGNNVIMNEGKNGSVTCDVYNQKDGSYVRTDVNKFGSRFIKEYPTPPGWALQIKLPGNSPYYIYSNFIISGEVRIAAKNDFTFYLEYGHKVVAGTANVSIKGVEISFGPAVNVSKAPTIGVFTPKN